MRTTVWLIQITACCAILQTPALWAADPAVNIRLLRRDPFKSAIEPALSRLSNIDVVYVEICADRKDPRFQGKTNPAISIEGATYAGWRNPESVPASVAAWRDAKPLRAADFSLEEEAGTLDPIHVCAKVDLLFPVPREQKQREQDAFWTEYVTLLESAAHSADDRRKIDLVKQNKSAMIAYFGQSDRENLPGKYAVTATMLFARGSAVSDKLSFEIEDHPGFYRSLLEKLKKNDNGR